MLVKKRLKNQAYLNKGKVPEYYEGQLVFVKSQIPGATSTFKVPYKGPYQILKILERNVELVDLETGREHASHLEFLKPLSLKEFRLVLNKHWNLNNNLEKRIRKTGYSSILDAIDDPYSLESVMLLENNDSSSDSDDEDPKDSDSARDPIRGPSYEEDDYDPGEGTSQSSTILINEINHEKTLPETLTSQAKSCGSEPSVAIFNGFGNVLFPDGVFFAQPDGVGGLELTETGSLSNSLKRDNLSNTETTEFLNKLDNTEKKKSNLKKLKRVGFKSFLTNFFNPDEN